MKVHRFHRELSTQNKRKNPSDYDYNMKPKCHDYYAKWTKESMKRVKITGISGLRT